MSEKVTASILIIGNEILSGRTQDVNISYIAKTLGDWGIVVEHCRVIPDVEQIIIDSNILHGNGRIKDGLNWQVNIQLTCSNSM